MYQKDNCIYIIAMLAGVESENIFISLNSKILTLKFNRQKINTNEKIYNIQELFLATINIYSFKNSKHRK